MKLYVIRHGNTDSNRLDIYNGKLLNEDINNIGIIILKLKSII